MNAFVAGEENPELTELVDNQLRARQPVLGLVMPDNVKVSRVCWTCVVAQAPAVGVIRQLEIRVNKEFSKTNTFLVFLKDRSKLLLRKLKLDHKIRTTDQMLGATLWLWRDKGKTTLLVEQDNTLLGSGQVGCLQVSHIMWSIWWDKLTVQISPNSSL